MRQASLSTDPSRPGDKQEIERLQHEVNTYKRLVGFPELPGLDIEELIVQSGQARVFRGVYSKTKQVVAVKVFSAGNAAREEMEIILHAGTHPNVIQVVTYCESPPCVVTPYLNNGDLNSFLKKYGAQNASTTTRLAIGIAKGLQFLHEKRIIHRDLKSHNVLLDKDYNPVIADFGLSRLAMHTIDSFTNDKEKGTLRWMAPECFQTQKYSLKVDIYAFAIILWELLSGQDPYVGLTSMQVMNHVANRKRPLINPTWDQGLVQLMQKCWDQEPQYRPAAVDIIDVLDKKENETQRINVKEVTSQDEESKLRAEILRVELAKKKLELEHLQQTIEEKKQRKDEKRRLKDEERKRQEDAERKKREEEEQEERCLKDEERKRKEDAERKKREEDEREEKRLRTEVLRVKQELLGIMDIEFSQKQSELEKRQTVLEEKVRQELEEKIQQKLTEKIRQNIEEKFRQKVAGKVQRELEKTQLELVKKIRFQLETRRPRLTKISFQLETKRPELVKIVQQLEIRLDLPELVVLIELELKNKQSEIAMTIKQDVEEKQQQLVELIQRELKEIQMQLEQIIQQELEGERFKRELTEIIQKEKDQLPRVHPGVLQQPKHLCCGQAPGSKGCQRRQISGGGGS